MKKKAIVIVIVVAIVLAIVSTAILLPKMMSPEEEVVSNTAYVMSVAEVCDSGNRGFSANRFAGVVENGDALDVTADIDKTIKTTFVKEGDVVKKGDKLFEYDVDEMKIELEQSKLELDEAKSQTKNYTSKITSLENQKAKTTDTNEKLNLENEISTQKLESKRNEYNIKSIEKQIEKLEKSIKNNVIKAEKGGTIKSVGYSAQSMDSISTMGSADVYIQIIVSENYQVRAEIGEGNIDKFPKDTDVLIRSRTKEDTMWFGKVKSIENPVSNNDMNMGMGQTVTKYPVIISVDKGEEIRVGQHITVEVADMESMQKEGLWIEGSYICDAETSPYVWCKGNDGALEKRSITLGKYDENDGKYKIEKGLSEEDYIAFPEEYLTEGMTVEISGMFDGVEEE